MALTNTYTRKTILLIIIAAAVKLAVSPFLELGNDEVYYWTYAIRPDWNYFDHPPMVGLLIRFTTFNLNWVSEFSIRLGSVVCAALSTWFIFKTGKLLSSERVGWYGALLYTASIYTTFIAGFFILPDSPQMPFYTAALYVMVHIIQKRNEVNSWSTWLVLGLLIGLAALCKVHGLFLWIGFGLFILIKRRSWLLNPRLYVAGIISVCCLLPILYWNIRNDFITYKFHSGRVTHSGIDITSFMRELAGEFAYQNPIVYVLIIIAIISFLRGDLRFRQSRVKVWIFSMSIPMLLVFWGIALRNPTLPHWSGPAYIPLFFLAALWLDKNTKRVVPISITIAFAFIIFTLISATAIVQLAPRNFGSQDKENYGEYCPTLDLSGWKDFAKSFDSLRSKDIAEKIMTPNDPIITNKWFPGAHIEFYVTRPLKMNLIGIGELTDLHQFVWLNKDRAKLVNTGDAYLIIPSNLPFDVLARYGKQFREIEKPVIINQIRSGVVVRYFYVYRMRGYRE
ncbi:MAG: glycosyltransferase family 39 protein [Chitinophagaceae bacterium]|nr:glycosyltransferase family 39 protein [Chitinophagaceae bacterium]